jgi:hypothetical protein
MQLRPKRDRFHVGILPVAPGELLLAAAWNPTSAQKARRNGATLSLPSR